MRNRGKGVVLTLVFLPVLIPVMFRSLASAETVFNVIWRGLAIKGFDPAAYF